MNTDFIISVGPACRPAWHLQHNNLRFISSPFDWMSGVKLQTVSHFIAQKSLKGFFEIREDLNINKKNKAILDKTYNLKSLHHFPASIDMDEYYPKFFALMDKRFERCLKAFEKSQHIVFLSHGRSLDELEDFLYKFNISYPNKTLVFINVEHDPSLNDVSESNQFISNNICIRHVKFNDIHKNGNSKNNPHWWIGNIDCWKKLCSEIKLNSPQLLMDLNDGSSIN